jgi:DNA gyrase subunit A
MQARVMLEDIGGGKTNIVVTELPYGVNKTTVIEKLAREVRDGRITGVTDLRDESDYTGMRMVIEVSRNADPADVLTDALKYSQLRETFGVINLARIPEEDGTVRPQYLSLSEMLTHFVNHRLEVIVRRSEYELEKRLARLHIVEGLLKALDILDEVIDTIRRSRTPDTARNNLVRKFGFTEVQATAILNMQLRRLAALERRRLADERKELKARIEYLEGLLASEAQRLAVIIEETEALKDAYAQPRRTVIIDEKEDAAGRGTFTTQSDLVMPEKTQLLILTPNGIERRDASGYYYRLDEGLTSRAPAGGGHLAHIEAEPDDHVLLFSNHGRGWMGNVGFVPEQAEPDDLGLGEGETLIAADVIQPDTYLIMVSKQGKIKRTQIEDLDLTDRNWARIMGLSGEDDGLLMGTLEKAGAHVLFYTAQGQLLRIDGDAINPQQTGSASGVAGIRLRKGDELIGATVVPDGENAGDTWQVVVASERGYVHRFPLKEISVKGRNTMGVRCLNVTQTTGPVGDVAVGIDEGVDLYLVDGRRQHIEMAHIPSTSRATQGDRVIDDPDEITVDRVVILK